MAQGIVKWFDSKLGYGFIRNDSLGEVFVHHSAILGEGFKTLRRNEQVEFEIVKDPRGLQAANVIRSGNNNSHGQAAAGEPGAETLPSTEQPESGAH